MKAFCFINSLYQKSSLKHKLKLSFKADCILKCFAIERIYALKAFVYTRDALNVLPSIYFHGNYNVYREHNNIIE